MVYSTNGGDYNFGGGACGESFGRPLSKLNECGTEVLSINEEIGKVVNMIY